MRECSKGVSFFSRASALHILPLTPFCMCMFAHYRHPKTKLTGLPTRPKSWNVAAAARNNGEWSAFRERERKKKKNQRVACTSGSQCIVFIPAPAEHSEVQAISPVTFPDSITHSWEGKERKKAAGIELQSSRVFQPAGGARSSRVRSSQPGIAVFVMMRRFWTEQCW